MSCGDPAGIGPELAAKAWAELRGALPFVYLGAAAHLPRGTPAIEVADPAEAHDVAPRAVPVMPVPFDGPARPGRLDPRHAPGTIRAIREGAALAASGRCAALCTLPITKKALQDGAAFAFPGHTEYLAHLAGDVSVAMMLAAPALRVVPATIHVPLADVPAALTEIAIERAVRLAHAALIADFATPAPRVAVAGLNPHAGEGGAMGREEIEVIAPALERLRAEGIDVVGPLSADTMFHPAARARYDVAVAMYHDQALIPIKTIDFAGGVNVTLGLPYARTSPDHGTAHDIAGTGTADPTSFVAALMMAADMGARRRAAA